MSLAQSNRQPFPLLRLPIEVRLMVYEYATTYDDPAWFPVEVHDEEMSEPSLSKHGSRTWYYRRSHVEPRHYLTTYVVDPHPITRGANAWGLLWACGTTRREAMPIIFAHETFYCTSVQAAEAFLGDLHPHQRQHVRKINISMTCSYWESPVDDAAWCRAIDYIAAEVPRLCWLRFHVLGHRRWSSEAPLNQIPRTFHWIECLGRLRGLEYFDFSCELPDTLITHTLASAVLAWAGRHRLPGWSDKVFEQLPRTSFAISEYFEEKVCAWLMGRVLLVDAAAHG